MSEIKVRDYVRSSSLGSYFGVGFNSPKDQFLLDTGQAVQEFDDDAQARMDLGNELEDAHNLLLQVVTLRYKFSN